MVSNNNPNIVSINKDQNIGTHNNISAVDINKDKNIDNRFGNTTINKIDENIRKKLKIIKSKVFIAIINHKKFYLPKKISVTKFP